nr:hypothetical protein [Tanacetum cinerariifolium]
MSLLQKALDALTRRVENLEYDKVAQALEITKLKRRVKKLEKGNKARVLKLRRLQKVGTSQRVDTSNDNVMGDESNQGMMINEMDKDDVVILMDEKRRIRRLKRLRLMRMLRKVGAAPSRRRKGVDPAVQRYQVMKRKPQTKAQARKNMMMYLKNVAGFKLDYFKGISYDGIRISYDGIRPIFEAKFNSNIAFLLKIKEQMEEEENRTLQTINETPAQKVAKRRKLNEEVEDLKRHLEIMLDEDDDIYTEATPLARKVSVMDYKIIELNNQPYYKIIRADRTHQLYISFLTLLKNFDG